MTDDRKQTSTPKLRFPEFREWPGWENTRLGQVVDFQSGGTPSKDTPAFWNGSIPWVTAKDMKQLFLDDTEDHITPAAVDDGAKQVPAGTVLILTRGMTLLKDLPTCVLRRPMSFNQDVKALHPKGDLDGCFLPWLVLGNKERLLRIVNVAGHGTGKLDTEKLRVFDVTLPQPREQQKIADCLTSLDELIMAHGRKLEALRAQKKGLMQQLFPRQGQTAPRLRFSELRDASEWRVRKLSDVLKKASIPIEVETAETYREIGVRSHGKGIFHKEPISGSTIGEKRVFRVVENAFVVNIVFAWEQAVATTSKEEAGMIASHRFPMYVPKSEDCDVRFIKLAFLTPAGKHLLGVASPGGAGRNRTLGQAEFEKLEIVMPSKEEQTKIADAIDAVDDLITSQAEMCDALQAHKKGLMQQLFPSPEGVES
jgi:type I restriction enzyme S subunit